MRVVEAMRTTKRKTGHPDTTHPEDLLHHMRFHHGLPIPEHTPREVLELAHAQRHDGFGVGADHAPTAHDYEDRGWE